MKANKFISIYAKTDLSDASKWYENEVHIKAIFHTSQSPEIWEQRI